ncbi:hypothetical protein KDN24_12705 [Bacillus sp. Bva_UNVM-123]|uniref:hypothetical protein n=1 Tax=Bacillus sp. Bva_UNVM-123 TaxID=2829798 RepID=UPI00391F0A69
MKKLSMLFIFFIFIFASSIHALSWAYPFVVWKGKVYEVKQEVMIADSEIGKRIGEVRTKPNDMTGRYYGNASNYFPKGTEYYEIVGLSISSAIAVKDENVYVKAEFIHKAPFHIMNIFTSTFFFIFAGVSVLIIIGILYRTKMSTKY